jgi:hypothetical protein
VQGQIGEGAREGWSALRVTNARGAVGQFGGHPVVVLAQPDQLSAAPDLGAELGGTPDQQTIGDGLRDTEDV